MKAVWIVIVLCMASWAHASVPMVSASRADEGVVWLLNSREIREQELREWLSSIHKEVGSGSFEIYVLDSKVFSDVLRLIEWSKQQGFEVPALYLIVPNANGGDIRIKIDLKSLEYYGPGDSTVEYWRGIRKEEAE